MKKSEQHVPDVTKEDVERIVNRDIGASDLDKELEMMAPIQVREKQNIV